MNRTELKDNCQECWAVYDADGQKVVSSSGNWLRPKLPEVHDLKKFKCFSVGTGDDSNYAGFNFRYIVHIRHHKESCYWRLEVLTIYLDTPRAGQKPDERGRIYPDQCVMETAILAELVTPETDTGRAVRRLIEVYLDTRNTLDWSCLQEDGNSNDPQEIQVCEVFYELQAQWYEKKSND
jgi:hypothetical protein